MTFDLSKAKVGDTVVLMNAAKATIYEIHQTLTDDLQISYEAMPFMYFFYKKDGSPVHGNTIGIMQIVPKEKVDLTWYTFLHKVHGVMTLSNKAFKTEEAAVNYVKNILVEGTIVKVLGRTETKHVTSEEYTYVKY